MGGATFTIVTVLLMVALTNGPVRLTAIASAVALTISHIPVAIVKKLFPRKRPYLVLDEIFVTDKPLKDHSFPSGHTTAIFSVIIPFILFVPSGPVSLLLFLTGIIVGMSRIFLGLHYPSDVLVGSFLGIFSGYIAYTYMLDKYLHLFIM